MRSGNAHGRALAYLVARALVGALSADRARQLDVAAQMLAVMQLDSLEGMEDVPGGQDSQMVRVNSNLRVCATKCLLWGLQLVDDRSLGLKVVLKPAGRTTSYYLKTALFAMLPQIARPAGVALDWYADSVRAFY